MKTIKLSIANPYFPITILLFLSFMFIAIAKISANGNFLDATNSLAKKEINTPTNQILTSASVIENRTIKLYPIYN